MALEQAASRHDEDDLERLRLTAAREGSVPWFEARWRLALFVSGNKVELPLLVLVVINSAVVGLQTYRKFGDAINAALVISQHVCTAIFAAEVLLKLVAFGPRLYFTNRCVHGDVHAPRDFLCLTPPHSSPNFLSQFQSFSLRPLPPSPLFFRVQNLTDSTP